MNTIFLLDLLNEDNNSSLFGDLMNAKNEKSRLN
jgi:hypothetical protein